MSDVVSAGKRGRAWSCKNCKYQGERHMVMAHLFRMHLTMDDWPYQCPLCDFSHYHHPTFLKHTKWYRLHKVMVGQKEVELPAAGCRPDLTGMAERMAEQLSVEDSLKVWEERKRRPSMAPMPVGEASGILPGTTPICCSSQPQSPPTASEVPIQVDTTPSQEPDGFLSLSDSLVLLEDTSEFFVEKVDKSTNTSPLKESQEIRRLLRVTQRQERALGENTTVVRELQSLLRRHGVNVDDNRRKIHHGDGRGERSNITSGEPTPPPSVKSVVYQMPSSRRPRISSRPASCHRPSPLDSLFKPDPISKPRSRSSASRR